MTHPHRRCRIPLAATVALAGLLLPGRAPAAPLTFTHEDVLGTALEIVVETGDPAAADAAEEAVLAAIDRMAAVVSTYDPASEMSRWLAGGTERVVSDELAAVLRACDHWRQVSSGAFHPGVAAATRLWREAERSGEPPAADRIAGVAARLTGAPWEWRGARVVPRSPAVTLDALAKGAIIDAACRAALAVGGVDGVMVNIGGDLAVRGSLEREVVVARPGGAARDGGVLDRLVVADRAVATSGDAYRGFTVAGRRHSHVIDPRTARPADGVRSASVIAPTAADADALATICCVLAPAESIALVESRGDASCLILDSEGVVHTSREWPGTRSGRGRTAARLAAFAAPAAGEPTQEFVLELEINRPNGGGRYRRPYVAAWVEDGDGFPVKTLVLWVQRDGQRWLPDLKRWYRAERLRKIAEDTELVATVSEATRQPGSHAVTWDGSDNGGTQLPPGKYTICIEAAREHGTYQFDRRTVSLGAGPFRETFAGNDEIKSATFEARAVAAPR